MKKHLLPFLLLFVSLNTFAQVRDTSCVPYYDTVTVNICNGDTYLLPDSVVVDSSGFYASAFQTFDMCDSIIYTDLSVTIVDTSFAINIPTCGCPTVLHANANSAGYQWLNCNTGYSVIPGATGQDYTVHFSGNYCVAITQNGCTDTSDCYYVLNTGIERMTSVKELGLFPSPATTGVRISFWLETAQQLSFIVVNNLGQELIKEEDRLYLAGNNSLNISLTELKQGLYYLRTISTNEEHTLKFIKAE